MTRKRGESKRRGRKNVSLWLRKATPELSPPVKCKEHQLTLAKVGDFSEAFHQTLSEGVLTTRRKEAGDETTTLCNLINGQPK